MAMVITLKLIPQKNLKQAIDYIKSHDYLIGKIVTTGKQIAIVTNTITTIIN